MLFLNRNFLFLFQETLGKLIDLIHLGPLHVYEFQHLVTHAINDPAIAAFVLVSEGHLLSIWTDIHEVEHHLVIDLLDVFADDILHVETVVRKSLSDHHIA